MQVLNITTSDEPGKLSLNDARAGSTMNNSGQVFKSYIPTLSKSQVEVFNTDGYLVIPGVLTASECGALHDEAQKVIQNVMEGGKGITMQGGSGVEQMLPIGRVLATFETGKYAAFHACLLFAFEKRWGLLSGLIGRRIHTR